MTFVLNDFLEKERLKNNFYDLYENAYMPIAIKLANWKRTIQAPLVIGINGAQGTGKSTLSRFMEEFLESEFGFSVFILSLDDIYKTRIKRLALSKEVHHLLKTRGVPGTHDIDYALKLFKFITNKSGQIEFIPTFRKEIDDRDVKAKWKKVKSSYDLIIFEGWCISARPQPHDLLFNPINKLEEIEDPHGIWRNFVNESLAKSYAEVFSYIDYTIFLRIPNFNNIFEWRMEQENKLKDICEQNKSDEDQSFMSKSELHFFISHYERLTKWMLQDIPIFADVILDFNEDRSFKKLYVREDAK